MTSTRDRFATLGLAALAAGLLWPGGSSIASEGQREEPDYYFLGGNVDLTVPCIGVKRLRCRDMTCQIEDVSPREYHCSDLSARPARGILAYAVSPPLNQRSGVRRRLCVQRIDRASVHVYDAEDVDLGKEGEIALSPNGSQLVYTKSALDGGVRPMMLLRLKPGARPSVLAHGVCYSPAWSPDGRSVAFFTQTSDNCWFRLTLLDLETGTRRVVKPVVRIATPGTWEPEVPPPLWSPKGDSLIFAGHVRGKDKLWEGGLWFLDVRHDRHPTCLGGYVLGGWLPGGKELLLTDCYAEPSVVYRTSPDGRRKKVVAEGYRGRLVPRSGYCLLWPDEKEGPVIPSTSIMRLDGSPKKRLPSHIPFWH